MRFQVRRANLKFETYYTRQRICETDAEIRTALDVMRTNLPAAFRLNTSRPGVARRLRKILKSGKLWRADPETAAKASPVDPSETIWRLDHDRFRIGRRLESPENNDLHDFLFYERQLGNLLRQELVSQVPVLMLDIKESDKILDMCSSPGSKTCQVIELMHKDAAGRIPTGAIVANEYNAGRCHKLASGVRIHGSPCLILVNHDGRAMPEIYETDDDGKRKTVRWVPWNLSRRLSRVFF